MAAKAGRVSVSVKGSPEAEAAIAQIKKAFAPELIQREVLLPAARIVRDAARANVPTGPGHFQADTVHLKDNIFAAIGKRGLRDVIVGLNFEAAPQGYWLETGTAPHMIHPKKSGGRLFISKLRRFLRFAHHPGQKRKPWMRPAATQSRGAVSREIQGRVYNVLMRYGLRQRPTPGISSEQTGWVG